MTYFRPATSQVGRQFSGQRHIHQAVESKAVRSSLVPLDMALLGEVVERLKNCAI